MLLLKHIMKGGLLGMAVLGAGASLAADKWTSPQDAVGQLWSARLPLGASWTPAQCSNYAALPQAVQGAVSSTQSGLVIPRVKLNRAVLTNGLRQMATALLVNYPLGQAQANIFYPGNDVDGPLNMTPAFWAEQARSPHGNERNHLPTINLGNLNLAQCPDLANVQGRQTVMDTLNAANLTNRQRWHCYANRFRTVGGAQIALTGYVEITQAEYPADNQYAYAASDGRLVFDYVNGRVFYTPAHYKQWKKTDFAPDQTGGYGCTPAGSCCNPFFELVP